jgi:MFS family permease
MSSGTEIRSGYRGYLLAVLTIILAFNAGDRYALGMVLESIKVDLHASDAELGLLSGIAFSFFYSTMGIPIAYWADRGDRVRIIGLLTTLWSVAVALCSRAHTFLQLLMMRMLVGVGEAGCVPPAHSLIADVFARQDRPRAMSIYVQGYSLSLIIGYFLAGWMQQSFGWRLMFVLIGLPGPLLGALAWLTLKEPRRSQTIRETSTHSGNLREVLKTLSGNRTFRTLLLAYCLACFFVIGIQNWLPTYFVRTFGLEPGELGTWFALVSVAPGILGSLLAGQWASRHAVNNEALQLRMIGLVNAGFNGVILASTFLLRDYRSAFALMALSNVGSAAILGPLFATIQTLVPTRMRAVAIAIVFLFGNLIGMGLGPVLIGVLSDAMQSRYGAESLRYALLAVSPGVLWVSWYYFRASKTIERDRAREEPDEPVSYQPPLETRPLSA